MTNTDKERLICCCGIEGWASLIAWLQIILNVLALLMTILTMLGVSTDENLNDHVYYSGAVMVVLVIAFLFSVVGMIFGIILLKGVNERHPSYLKAWIIFTSLLLVWTVLGAALGRSGISIWMRLSLVFLQVLIYGFGIWIVYTFKTEIENKIPIIEQRF